MDAHPHAHVHATLHACAVSSKDVQSQSIPVNRIADKHSMGTDLSMCVPLLSAARAGSLVSEAAVHKVRGAQLGQAWCC